jgi:hypothetical protein
MLVLTLQRDRQIVVNGGLQLGVPCIQQRPPERRFGLGELPVSARTEPNAM